MDAVEWVQEIQREPEFKELCDALLRLEVGPLVQVYAGKGADGGIDASYEGTFADATGRWVFQYKFIHPSTDPNRARSRLEAMFVPSGKRTTNDSEFAKPGIRAVCGYVLLTNVAVTVPLEHKIRNVFVTLHPHAKFCIWDPASLNLLLQSHPHLARSRSQAMEELCLEHVINPLWEWLVKSEVQMFSWDRQENTIWPLRFSLRPQHVAAEAFFERGDVDYKGQISYEGPPLQADQRVLNYAVRVAFPHALSRLGEYLKALRNLFNVIAECVKELTGTLRQPQGPLSIFSQEERNQMSLGLACVLLEGAWGFPSHYPVFDNSRILAYSFYIYEGDKGMMAQAHLEEYGKRLRNQYEHGRRLPAKVLEAREHLRAVLQAFADALWYPATIGIDAPRDSSDDESGPE